MVILRLPRAETMKRFTLLTLAILFGAVSAAPAIALAPGDVLLPVRTTLLQIDPGTGDRTTVSHTSQVDRCVDMSDPFACCVGPEFGDGTEECAPSVGAGDSFGTALAVAVHADGEPIVACALGKVQTEPPNFFGLPDRGALFRVDSVTGDRTYFSTNNLVSDCKTLNDACLAVGIPLLCCTGVGMGTCPGGLFPYACCTGSGTGDGTAPCVAVGRGPGFIDPVSIARQPDGDFIVYDLATGQLIEVNAGSGDRFVFASDILGVGPSVAGAGSLGVVGALAQAVPSVAWPVALVGVLFGVGAWMARRGDGERTR